MKKRLLAVLLSLMMVVSMMSAMTVTSFAGVSSAEQTIAAEQIEKVEANELTDVFSKITNLFKGKAKDYNLLIGVKNVRITKGLKDEIKSIASAFGTIKKFDDIPSLIEQLSDIKSIQIKAKDVVEFANLDGALKDVKVTSASTVAATKVEGTFSPILVAQAGDRILVKAYKKSHASGEATDLPQYLMSVSGLLPSGFTLTEIGHYSNTGKTDDGCMVYQFKMPKRMVTGYDFVALQKDPGSANKILKLLKSLFSIIKK